MQKVITSSLLNSKVLFNNEENLISILKSNFKNPKGDVKSNVMAENEAKSNNFVSPNRFSCLNNYRQFKNSVDFNKEIAQVMSSNILTTSKGSTDISHSKERSKEPIRDQIRSSQHSPLPNINSNQEHSKEPIRDKKIRTNRTNAPISTIIGDTMIKKKFCIRFASS